jgi:hypothetical protein
MIYCWGRIREFLFKIQGVLVVQKLFSVVIILSSLSIVLAQVPTDQPRIKFESTTFDMGQIKPESKNLATYTFTNVGKSTLKILDIQKTCGCTPFELAKREYAPGESGTLKVEYQATKQASEVLKHLYVTTNDPDDSKIQITLKGLIVIQVGFEPSRLKLSLDSPDANVPTITLFSKNDKPFAIKSIESVGNTISADFDPNKSATKFVIKPRVDLEKLKYNLNGFLKFHVTHPDIDEVIIGYMTPPEVETQPATIIVRPAEPNKAIQRELYVKSNYNRPFEIESITSKSGHVTVLQQEKLNNEVRLVLEVTPPDLKKAVLFSDVLTIKTKAGTSVEVNCRGFYSR